MGWALWLVIALLWFGGVIDADKMIGILVINGVLDALLFKLNSWACERSRR